MAYKSSGPFLSRDAGPNLALPSSHLSAPRSYTSPQKSQSLTEFQNPGRHTAPVYSYDPYDQRSKSNISPYKTHTVPELYKTNTAPEFHKTNMAQEHGPIAPASSPAHSYGYPVQGHTNSASAYTFSGGGNQKYLMPQDAHNQPHSFPTRNQKEWQSKPYHSLDSRGDDAELGTPVDLRTTVPHHPSHSDMHHQLSQSSSSVHVVSAQPRPLSNQNKTVHVASQRIAGRIVSSNTRSYSDNTLLSSEDVHMRQQVRSSASHQSIPTATYRFTNPIPRAPSHRLCSQATLENERYSLNSPATSDHLNEDRHFSLVGRNYTVLGVFDGHDGPRAVGFASNYMMTLFDTASWSKIADEAKPSIIREALGEFFRVTDQDFFRNIQQYIDEKNAVQRLIPQELSSYAAYQQYPYEVSRLQEIEPKLTGGCTAVLAIIVNEKLYIANAGDSRAVLVSESRDGILSAKQLSVDHSVENEDELKRLESLGLDPRELIRSGRLGMQENTRSIGDYSIKQGYRDVDTLRIASSAPGIVDPYIMPAKTIDHAFKYLILMTDGVYKSIESTFKDQDRIDSNKVLLGILDRSIEQSKGTFEHVADSILARVRKIHSDCYEVNAGDNPRSSMAVACRKRDDMTLLVYKFPASQ